MRVGLVILAVAGALLLYAGSRILGFAEASTTQTQEPIPEARVPDLCPKYTATRLPPKFVLRSRAIRNLGNETMGRSYVYGDGRRSVEVHVGFDALDLYEDLDFVQHAVEVGGKPRTLHVPGSLGGRGFLGLTWDAEGEHGACAELTLIGRRLDRQTFLEIASGVRPSNVSRG